MRKLMSAVRSFFLLVAILFMSTGCSRYLTLPLGSTPPERGTVIRAHLRQPDEFPAGPIIVPNVSMLSGELVEVTDDDVVLSLLWLQGFGESEFRGEGETIVIPWDNLQVLEVKKIAPVQTAVFIGLIVVAAALLPLALSGGGGAPLTDGGGGNNTN